MNIETVYNIVLSMKECLKSKNIDEFNSLFVKFTIIVNDMINTNTDKDIINVINYCRYVITSIYLDLSKNIYNVNYMNSVLSTLDKFKYM